MKALLSRFNRGHSKQKDQDIGRRLAAPPLPPLPEWPPPQPQRQPPPPSPTKPLPELSPRPLPPIAHDHDPAPEYSHAPRDASAATDFTHVEYNTPSAPSPVAPPVALAQSSSAASTTTDEHAPSPAGSPRLEGESNGRSSSRKASTFREADNAKKVAFISPPQTPAPAADQTLYDEPNTIGTNAAGNASTTSIASPMKTQTSRFHAAHGKDPRGSTSTNGSSSKTEVASTSKGGGSTVKLVSTRSTTSPHPGKGYNDAASTHQSMRSGTPYSQTSGYSSKILAVTSWSEGAEDDLVSNLGPRERTRQEVLWEIVASEERYVAELQKLKETFIEPLLHPYSTSPVASPMHFDYDDYPRAESPLDSIDHLPIASRFLSPTPFRSDTPASPRPGTTGGDSHRDAPHIDGDSFDSDEEEEHADRLGRGPGLGSPPRGTAAKHSHPHSPYRATATRTATASGGGGGGKGIAFPSRSHQSLPPPPRGTGPSASTASLGRQSFVEPPPKLGERKDSAGAPSTTGTQRVLRKFKKSNPSAHALANGGVSPHQLPEDLKKCLEVIETVIFDGNNALSKGLRKRYDEQYPLVRSLADVFVANSHILHGYATYVLHLERALEQVDNALSTASATKKPKKQTTDEWLRVCQFLQKLEENSAEKGETGLAISLSKPFQRLLKYPLLFQNLLYHTDPSTFEYESTLQMVAEVETIVRSIEDEKIQKEERDRTRDVFARIEGLEKDRQLALPKPSRLLVEERQLVGIAAITPPSSAPPVPGAKAVKGKASFKRLSDVLQGSNGVGGKKDMWLVVFNDVALRCQRTGTTSLPLVAATNTRTNSLPDLQGKSKYATTGRRHSHTKPRNLYKFIKIETWVIGDVVQPRQGVVSMEDVARSRQQHMRTSAQPRIVPMPDDDDDEDRAIDSDDSDRKSKMSFSYWGADKVTLQKPVIKSKPASGLGSSNPRRSAPAQTSYGRESSANAKFGTRLVVDPAIPGGPAQRPASRRTQATPTSRRPAAHSEDGHVVRSTVTRPAWGAGSTAAGPTGRPAAAATAAPQPTKRQRNTSQPSERAVRATTTSAKPSLASPAPSEDSGVGLYRQIMSQDPSLKDI